MLSSYIEVKHKKKHMCLMQDEQNMPGHYNLIAILFLFAVCILLLFYLNCQQIIDLVQFPHLCICKNSHFNIYLYIICIYSIS